MASDYESEGQGFESLRVYHFFPPPAERCGEGSASERWFGFPVDRNDTQDFFPWWKSCAWEGRWGPHLLPKQVVNEPRPGGYQWQCHPGVSAFGVEKST